MNIEQKIQEEIDSQIRYGLRLTEFGKEQIRKRMIKEYDLLLNPVHTCHVPTNYTQRVSMNHTHRFGDCEQRVYRGY